MHMIPNMHRRFPYLFLLFIMLCSMVAMAQKPVYTRDASGRVVVSRHDVFDNLNRLAVRIEYTYDSLGTVRFRTLSSFDKKGRLVAREQYNAFDYLLLDEAFRYDCRGNLKRRTTTVSEETGETFRSEEKRKYKYDKNDSIVYRAYYLDGKLYYEYPPKDTVKADTPSPAIQQPDTKADSTIVVPVIPADSVKATPPAKVKNKSRRKKKTDQ